MKHMYLPVLLVPVLLLGACKDVPRYEADEVIMVAKSLSHDCRATIGLESD